MICWALLGGLGSFDGRGWGSGGVLQSNSIFLSVLLSLPDVVASVLGLLGSVEWGLCEVPYDEVIALLVSLYEQSSGLWNSVNNQSYFIFYLIFWGCLVEYGVDLMTERQW